MDEFLGRRLKALRGVYEGLQMTNLHGFHLMNLPSSGGNATTMMMM
jgi:hypothetical protein